MEEFGMERAEAVGEAREQFHSQGVSLANIVTSGRLLLVVVVFGGGCFGTAGALGVVEERGHTACYTVFPRGGVPGGGGCCEGSLRVGKGVTG